MHTQNNSHQAYSTTLNCFLWGFMDMLVLSGTLILPQAIALLPAKFVGKELLFELDTLH